jgi:hypothetical protein
MDEQSTNFHQAALLTLAAIRATAQRATPSPLRSYCLDLTDDLALPERFPLRTVDWPPEAA